MYLREIIHSFDLLEGASINNLVKYHSGTIFVVLRN